MHRLAAEPYPICRSLTGDGIRRTLRRIAEEIALEVEEVPSGTPVLDWTLPDGWHAAPETADEVHTASGEAARIAREAGVGELVLIHVNPLLRSDDELLADAVSGFERATVGADLLEWSTPA